MTSQYRRVIIASCGGMMALLSMAWSGCQVAFNDLQKSNTFQCSQDSDCIDGFVCNEQKGLCEEACSSNQDCGSGKVCQNQVCVTGCIDDDGDGYGAPSSNSLTLCDACTNDNPKGCNQADCADDNPSINPGVPEACDGIDNNCNGKIDEPIPCGDGTSCPLAAPSDRSGTQIACQTVQRSGSSQKECVLEGTFPRNNCNTSKNQATCNNGSWGSLPDGCTMTQ